MPVTLRWTVKPVSRDRSTQVSVTELLVTCPVEIIGAPTVRSPDGLAMSSRNRYLSEAERALAPRIHATLRAVAQRVDGGERDWALLSGWGMEALRGAGMQPDYLELRDAATLLAPTGATRELVILTAARLGKARLIDNLRVALR